MRTYHIIEVDTETNRSIASEVIRFRMQLNGEEVILHAPRELEAVITQLGRDGTGSRRVLLNDLLRDLLRPRM